VRKKLLACHWEAEKSGGKIQESGNSYRGRVRGFILKAWQLEDPLHLEHRNSGATHFCYGKAMSPKIRCHAQERDLRAR
jgi:hypothetical protein